jgi:CheY-like chemotaxis protein/HPt (histidine-containing phosphotransfer) domain-containing protein
VSGSKLDQLEARLKVVREATATGFADRAAELAEAAARLDEGEPEARDQIRRLSHKLRGVAGSAGHPELGDRAGRLEQAAAGPATDLAIAEGARRLAKAAEDASSAPATGWEATAPRNAPSQVDQAALGWKVIALDDESATRRLLEITLKHGGCHAQVFACPSEAMASLQSGAPDLVIVDAMMPDVDGLEFYRGVRLHAGPSVPVVILSAASATELGWELPDDELLRWMRKPFRPASLLEELRAFVGSC